ncbi:MFS transporter [Bordetella genomosp. 1]|uniref:MFS transporter n=1 Tax=Bordetella genomosp. 1 TaxID=1395607 RepID=A0ABX4EZI7_9BORD|nr:MFS transporter [Bordetella genomosp. 1]MDQ8032402.1 MFS transporter [Bordetella sp.]OZI65165.1 MFS transporter [Bordetella genomosp. 1]
MISTITSFSSLYLATLLMLIGTGIFNTYMGLRLTGESVSEIWIGALIAAYYLGLVCGARMGHKLIIRVGHIRAFAACAAVATSMILAQSLIDYMPLWLALRLIAGIVMVTELMVIESWLNEQTENRQRGRVFSVYMMVSGLGTVLGQLVLTAYTTLGDGPLILVAMCLTLCLVPIAVTARSHPPTPLPAPLDVRFFLKRVPLSLTVLFVAGNLSGAFYGLAPVYAAKLGLSTSHAAMFVAAGVTAGLLAQWPMGWLSDRINRAGLIRFNAALLVALPVLMWGWLSLPYWLLLVLSGVFGILQFTLYPLGAAFANDHVESDRRVGLSAVLLMTYGVGACLGPLVAGVLMSFGGHAMYFVFITACALILVWQVRPARVTGLHQVQEAPVQFVPMPDTLQSSPAAVALDPRVDPVADPGMEMVTPESGVVQPPVAAGEAVEPIAAFENVEPATAFSHAEVREPEAAAAVDEAAEPPLARTGTGS